jgi:hypothetical protein
MILACVLGPAYGDDMASLPYSTLVGYQQRVDALQDLKLLKVWGHVGSKRPDVKASDIRLTIMRDAAHGGPLPIAVDADGHFTLPVDQALKDEDPMVVANQPKGSMQMSVTWQIIAPTAKDLHYSQLMLGVQQYNEAMHRQGFIASLLAPKAEGLLLIYLDGGHHLVMHAAGGDKTIPSKSYQELGDAVKGIDMSGMPTATTLIYLPMDETLLKQDPAVTLDALPDAVSSSYD